MSFTLFSRCGSISWITASHYLTDEEKKVALYCEKCIFDHNTLQENKGILTDEFVRMSSEYAYVYEFLTKQVVDIISSEKKIRRNFVRDSDDILKNTEKLHSDELPTKVRQPLPRTEFIGNTRFRQLKFVGIF